jgi:UDP-N-acetylglucosamine 2-epimerase (non-hydrolysing)
VEAELLARRPDVMIVVGDVTSTLAAALAAAKLGVPVVHVEAGLRARDWTMPEEINRVLTDQLADLLLTPSPDAEPNLLREGVSPDRIVFVGNVMIDSLLFALRTPTDALTRLGLRPKEYALVTLHRPSNVDSREQLQATAKALAAVASQVLLVFPVHPRTTARIASLGMEQEMRSMPGLRMIEPVGYNDFATLMADARLVATDSGGIQEETTALGVPCLTLRERTERPITETEGTNKVVGLDAERIAREVRAILGGKAKTGRVPAGWDGKAAERIVDAVQRLRAGAPVAKARSKGP